jgi:hypothetical protein
MYVGSRSYDDAMRRMMSGATQPYERAFQAGEYLQAPNPAIIQQKSYQYFLWLPMVCPPSNTTSATVASREPPAGETERANWMNDLLAFNRGLQINPGSINSITRQSGTTMDGTGYQIVETKKKGSRYGVQDLSLFIRRPLYESDKMVMTPEQMKLTLLSHMIPAADVNKWYMRSQMWPLMVKLAQGVLIEPRPEVLAAPCKFYSTQQLSKFVKTLGHEQADELKWREAFSTPSEMCAIYGELFSGSITDAAFSAALQRKAMMSGLKKVRNAKTRGYSNAGVDRRDAGRDFDMGDDLSDNELNSVTSKAGYSTRRLTKTGAASLTRGARTRKLRRNASQSSM